MSTTHPQDRHNGNGTRIYCATHRYADAGGLPCPEQRTDHYVGVEQSDRWRWGRHREDRE